MYKKDACATGKRAVLGMSLVVLDGPVCMRCALWHTAARMTSVVPAAGKREPAPPFRWRAPRGAALSMLPLFASTCDGLLALHAAPTQSDGSLVHKDAVRRMQLGTPESPGQAAIVQITRPPFPSLPSLPCTLCTRVDMVSFLHAMHLLDSDRAVQAAYRHLKPEGRLVVAWNDRCAGGRQFAPAVCPACAVAPCSCCPCQHIMHNAAPLRAVLQGPAAAVRAGARDCAGQLPACLPAQPFLPRLH